MNLRRVLAVLFTSATLAGCNCGGGGGDPDANNNQVATQLAFTQQPTSAIAGEAVAPAIQVAIQDAEGQVVTSADGTVTLALGANPGAGTLSGSVSASVVAGVATFSGLSIDKAGVGYTLTASSPDLSGAISSSFDISAAAPARLSWNQEPSDVDAGEVIAPPVQVRIEDAFGNLTDSTASVTLALQDNPGAGALQGNTTASAVAGVASFSELVLDVAADGYTLLASSGSMTSAASRTFNVRPGVPTQLVFTAQPTDAVAGAALSPPVQVEIRDARNNRVRSSTATVSLALATNPGGATLGGAVSVAAVSGVASFPALSLDRPGAGYSLQATSGSLTPATSGTFAVSPGAPASLAFTVQPSDSGSGSVIAPAVEVGLYDALGNLSASSAAVSLTLEASPSGGVLSGTTTRNASGGVARFDDLSLDRAGSYTLRATSAAGFVVSGTFSVAPGAPASLVFSQQPTNVLAGDAIAPAVVLSVLDAAGNVATSYAGPITVVLEANVSGGVLAGTTTVAAVEGVASFPALSINTAGSGYLLTGSTGLLAPVTSTPFAVSASGVTQLAFAPGPVDGTAGSALATVRVVLLDAYGNLTSSGADVTLSLGANPAGGTLGGTTTVAASSGEALFSSLTLQKAGTGYSLTANSAGLPPVTSGTFAIGAAAAAELVFSTQPVSTTVGGILPEVQVEVRDAYGNAAPGFSGSVALALVENPGGGTLTGTLSQPVVSGVAAFDDLSVDASGTGYTLGASASGLSPVTSAAFDIVAGAPSRLVFSTQPSDAQAGQSISPAVVVTVQDSGGNTVTSFTGTLSLALGAGSPSGSTLAGTTSVAASAGVASFPGLSIAQAGTAYTLVVSGGGLTPVTSASFDITPGAATQLVFAQQPTLTTAGEAISPAVQVELRDALGNRVTASSADVTLVIGNNAGGSTLTGTTTRAASAGLATFNDLTLNRTGNGYTLVASSGTVPTAESTAFNVAGGAASQLVFVQQPTSTVAGQAISPAVSVAVQDASGNTLTGYSGTLSVALGAGSPSGAVLSGTASVTVASGLGTFSDLSLAQAGTGYSLVASVAGLPPVTSTSFTIQVGAANRVVITQQPTSNTAGAALTPAVVAEIQDAFGNRVTSSSATVTAALDSNPTGATLSGTLSRAAVSGVATFSDLSVNLAGSGYTLQLDAAGLTSATSDPFDISTGGATRLAFVQQPSSTTAGSGLGTVSVEIQDASGNLITTATDAISLSISGGGVLAGTTTRSAVGGVASFTDLTVETAGSGYTLAAAAAGLSGDTSSPFSITAGTPSQIVFTQQPGNIAAGAAFAPAVAVQFRDAFGNPTSNSTLVTLTFANDPSGTASLLGTPAVTSSAGVATFTGLSVDRTGTGFTLQASASGVSPLTSAAFNVTPANASALAITQQPTQTAAGSAITPAVQVTVRDAFGNTVTSSSASVTLALLDNPGASTLTGTPTVAAASGVATFSNLRLNKVGTGYTLRATAAGLSAADTGAFDIVPGAADRLAFVQQPSNAQEGVVIAPAITVEVQDASGNRVTSAAVSVSLIIGNNPGASTLSGTTSQTTVSGLATFPDLALSQAATGYTLVASSALLTSATSADFNITVAGASGLVYTDPAAGGKLRLVLNSALSTPGTVVLDLVAGQALTGYAVGFNLPLDTTRVQANATLMETGTVLNPGSAPAAMMASLPTTGPLTGVLVTGQSQKASGAGAITTDSSIPAGSVFYRLRLDARAGATSGVVFDGAALGAQFMGLLRDKSGTDLAGSSDFRIGRLELF